MNKKSRKDASLGRGLNRRSFVKLLPAGMIAARVDFASDAAAQQQPPQVTQKVSKEQLHAAETAARSTASRSG
jgi:hypothetical protein